MKRRELLALLGGATATALGQPSAALAQSAKVPTIGVLVVDRPEPFLGQLREGLRELGYSEERNITLELRSGEGRSNLLAERAAELVQRKVDIIVAWQTPAVQAAKQATSAIPIVMSAGDPVGTGLIASLARPGGNITGMSGTTAELGSKMLELIRDILPATRRVAVLANATDPFTRSFLEQIEAGARTLDLVVRPVMIGRPEEIGAAFAGFDRERPDVVILQPSLPRKDAIGLALQHHLPAVSPNRVFVVEGGLMSYGARQSEFWRRTAFYVDKILKGSQPADLPVEQPTRFELVVNLKTAKALGLKIPESFLLRANEVIE